MVQKCQYLAKNVSFGRFWAKYPDFYGREQKFWYPQNGKPPRQLVRIVCCSGIGSNGLKMPIFGQKCQFWANFFCFWAKNPIFGGWNKTFCILISGNQ